MSRSLFLVFMATSLVVAGSSPAATFYTASFPDRTQVELSLDGASPSGEIGFDFDVQITLAEHRSIHDAGYIDSAKHKASVRCSVPGEVKIGDVAYPVSGNTNPNDWKGALWRAICMSPAT